MLKKILQVCGNLFFAFLKGKFYFFHMHISETSATTSTNIIVDFFFFLKLDVTISNLLLWLYLYLPLQCMFVVRGACGVNIGDDLSSVLFSVPTIDRLYTHGLELKAADGNRIAAGISPPNDLEKPV